MLLHDILNVNEYLLSPASFIIGLVLLITGIGYWYTRVQVPQDQILFNELREKDKERFTMKRSIRK